MPSKVLSLVKNNALCYEGAHSEFFRLHRYDHERGFDFV